MEPLDDYLLRVYDTHGKVNEAIYYAKERLIKQIKERETEERREILGGNEGIHLPNEE